MKSEYLRALEIQSEWLRWARSKGLGLWFLDDHGDPLLGFGDAKAERRAYDQCLREGECIYVNPQFCRLIDEAAPGFPDTAIFHATQLPSPHGFVWFDQHMYVGKVGKVGNSVRPAGWDGIVEGFPLFIAALGWVTASNGVQFLTFVEAREGQASGRQWLPFTSVGLREGDGLLARITGYEGDSPTPYADNDHHELRIFYTLLALMNQRLVTLTRVPGDRHAQRRAAKAGREAPGHVMVVEFRRKESHTRYTEVEEARAVEWKCRWIVRGHWRNQWHPSTGRHEPKWIEAFVKGPEGLPVKDDQRRVFAVVR